jgi:hypothetical protein
VHRKNINEQVSNIVKYFNLYKVVKTILERKKKNQGKTHYSLKEEMFTKEIKKNKEFKLG